MKRPHRTPRPKITSKKLKSSTSSLPPRHHFVFSKNNTLMVTQSLTHRYKRPHTHARPPALARASIDTRGSRVGRGATRCEPEGVSRISPIPQHLCKYAAFAAAIKECKLLCPSSLLTRVGQALQAAGCTPNPICPFEARNRKRGAACAVCVPAVRDVEEEAAADGPKKGFVFAPSNAHEDDVRNLHKHKLQACAQIP